LNGSQEGNWDLVENNIPVFCIQDSVKFPDLIHAVKPKSNNEIPQAASAHDTFYDVISLTPESMHMIVWGMSDRAIPRSFAMMEGFGVHTFRPDNYFSETEQVGFNTMNTVPGIDFCNDPLLQGRNFSYATASGGV